MNSEDLLLGKEYQVFDETSSDWDVDCVYLGYDKREEEYMFSVFDGEGFYFHRLIGFEISDKVRENEE